MASFFRVALALALSPLLSAFVPSGTLSAQTAPDSVPVPRPAIFAYLQLGDTVAYEAVRSDSAIVRGIFIVPRQGRIVWDHFLVAGVPASLRLSLYPGEDLQQLPASETEFVLRSDSMQVITRDFERVNREMRATIAGAIPVLGRSMLHVAYLGFHAAQSRLAELPLFLTSSGKSVRAKVSVNGETVVVNVDGLRVETLWEEGALKEVRVPDQGLVVVRMPPDSL